MTRRNHLLFLLTRLWWAACISLLLGLVAPAYAAITAYVTYQTHAEFTAKNPGPGMLVFRVSPADNDQDNALGVAWPEFSGNATSYAVPLGSKAGWYSASYNNASAMQATNCTTTPISFHEFKYLSDGDTINITITCTLPDTTPPTAQSAATSTDGTQIAITWSEVIDYYGDGTEFTVKQGGVPLTVTGAAADEKVLTLTVSPAITSGSTVSLSYSTTTSTGATVYDLAYNEAQAFSDSAVVNNSQVATSSLPTITSLSPARGSTLGGTSVTITGAHFSGAKGVTFGNAAASFNVDSNTQITATTPAHSAGVVPVAVTTPAGTITWTNSYTYLQPLVLDIQPTSIACHGLSTGRIKAIPSGGASPYTYSWSHSGVTADTATDLAAGTYTVTVTDATNQTISQEVAITQPAQALTAATEIMTSPSANANADGTAKVTASGGTPAYTYIWSPSGGTAATATGLAADTYTVTTTDANACTHQSTVTLYALPGAPTNVTATAGDNQASVTFTAPASNGGATITDYTVTANPADVGPVNGDSSPIVVEGLTNGQPYTFTVTARNAAGTGPASSASNSVTPAATQTITFAQPSSQNFGSTLTLTASSDSGLTPTFTSSTTTVCTITPEGLLTFVAQGTCVINADQLGNGSYLPATQVTRSFTVNAVLPGAPTIGTATVGDGIATVTFTAPANNGGAAITGYSVSSSPAGGSGTCTAVPPTSCTVTGLTNGTAYTFSVTATNSAGTSAASAASNSVTPASVPGAPTIGTATPGNAQTAVTFTAPTDSGGSPITGYIVTVHPGGATSEDTVSPIVVSGLTNGVAYTFTVAAKNAAATGAASSPSNSVTPQGVMKGVVPTPSGGSGTTGIATANIEAVDPVLDPNCRLAGAQFEGQVPPGFAVSYGSFEFLAAGCQHGVTISLTYPQALPSGVRFMKFGPPSFGAPKEWMDWTSKVQLSADRKTATYSVLDNDAGDSDPRPGLIADPIIPASVTAPSLGSATAIPTLSEWALALLSALLGALGWRVQQRRKAAALLASAGV